MEKDPNVPKQLIMYTNDAVEATFGDGSKVFLAPCATEYVVQQGNHTQGVMTTKHRTVYTTSTLLPRIRAVLSFRNLYAEQPFLVPTLVDSEQCYQSTGTATHVRWSPHASLPTISNDDPTQTWSWSSLCGRARIDISQCRQIIYVTHPLQVSRVLSKPAHDTDIPTKYIHIFAPVHRCFSTDRLPDYLRRFVQKCLQLIERLCNDQDASDTEENDDGEWSFQLPLPLPSSSCPKAHRHRLHHEMMFEADIRILQTTATVTYRLEYEAPTSIEAMILDEDNHHLLDYVVTREIQSSFYHYYSMKDKECRLLTLSEHALPPQNDRIFQIIRFMSNMRQRILSMTRRVQERPCWLQDDIALDSSVEDTIEQLKSSLLVNDVDVDESIYRETSIANVGHFKYFLDNHVQIRFSNGFILHMTSEQVHSCQMNPHVNFQCRITNVRKQSTIDVFDGMTEPGCYEQYISAAVDWCLWVWNEKRAEEQRHLASNIHEELFRLKLFTNMIEIQEYQQSLNTIAPVTNAMEYYSPDDIKQLLQRTAQFTGTGSSG